MPDFKNLQVWRKSHVMTLEVYRVTESFPRSEQFGLTSQIRRASASISANVAEGCARGSDRDMARFLRMALGSASELEYHFILARDLRLMPIGVYQELEAKRREVAAMLQGLTRRVAHTTIS